MMRRFTPLARTLLPAAVIWLAGCGKSAAQLSIMSDDQLLQELVVAKFQTVGYAGYDTKVRQTIVNRHPEWPSHIREAIARREVMIGMNKLQVGASLGSPHRVFTSVQPGGKFETWSYGFGSAALPTTASSLDRPRLVYFNERGIVTRIDS